MESWPTRDIQDGTSENEVNFIEETENPQMPQQSNPQMEQQSYWPAERALPHSSVSQLGSGLPSQTPPPSQILDPSESNTSATERPG